MFFAFLSLALFGVALFVAASVFHSRKDIPAAAEPIPFEPRIENPVPDVDERIEDRVPDRPLKVPQPEPQVEPPREEPVLNERAGREGEYIPILRIKGEIPGLKGRELVHFDGKGSLYSLESTAEPEKVAFKQEDLALVVEGRLLLTSRYIIVYSESVVKKFTIAAIESFHWQNAYLVMKRKRVKTKKDILNIKGNLKDFKYILHALT
jgi:hypothetical protein